MTMKVSILLSTYNGEKYLRNQLDSILRQKEVLISLNIRDDGSQDSTVSILREYENSNDNIHVIVGKQIGVGRSFMSLLFETRSNYDFYAFADQDDIWDEDKLIVGINKLKEYSLGPRLYVCNQRCIDRNGGYISDRFPVNFPVQNLKNALFLNLYAGCTMILNQELRDALCDSKRRPNLNFFDYRIHDSWTMCVASIYNPVIFDSECHMSFRRHDSNVTDAEVVRFEKIKVKTKIVLAIRKVKRLFKKNRKKCGIEMTAENLLRGYKDIINSEDLSLLIMVSQYRKSLKSKLCLLNSNFLKIAAPEKKFDLVLKIILNRL